MEDEGGLGLILTFKPFPDSPEKRQEFLVKYNNIIKNYDDKIRPLVEELERSSILSAEDYLITVY